MQLCLGADQMLWADRAHEIDDGLLVRTHVEDQVDPGHAAKTGIDLVEFFYKVVEGDCRQQGFGQRKKTVIPDGGDFVQRNGTHI